MRQLTFVLLAVALMMVVTESEGKTGAGCQNGYCWAYCSPFTDLNDWCYTSGGNNQDSKGYARCTGKGGGAGEYVDKTGYLQCSAFWGCNGACSL